MERTTFERIEHLLGFTVRNNGTHPARFTQRCLSCGVYHKDLHTIYDHYLYQSRSMDSVQITLASKNVWPQRNVKILTTFEDEHRRIYRRSLGAMCLKSRTPRHRF